MIKQACIFWWTGLKCIWIYLFLFCPLIFQDDKNKWGGLGPPRQGLLLGLSGLAHRISMVPGVPKHEDPEAMWHMPVCSGQFQIHSFWSLTEEGEILTQCHSASDILEVNRALCVLMAVNSRSVQGLSATTGFHEWGGTELERPWNVQLPTFHVGAVSSKPPASVTASLSPWTQDSSRGHTHTALVQ